jgi:surfeit locus 1 family protein
VFGIALKTRRVQWAAFATVVSLAILIALGVWQLHRLRWKENILAQIDRAESSPPVPLGDHPAPFTKVTATGLLLPGTALYGVQVHDLPNGQTQMGAQRLQILLRGNQPPLLVDLGWVPDGARPPTPSTRNVTILGYIRTPDHAGALSAEDDVQRKHFYTLDPAAIAPSLGVHHAAPYTLIAMGAMTGPNDPVPATELPRPQNNHLQYAFTWFGLAFALVAVFIAWARSAAARDPTPEAAPARPLALPAPNMSERAILLPPPATD